MPVRGKRQAWQPQRAMRSHFRHEQHCPRASSQTKASLIECLVSDGHSCKQLPKFVSVNEDDCKMKFALGDRQLSFCCWPCARLHADAASRAPTELQEGAAPTQATTGNTMHMHENQRGNWFQKITCDVTSAKCPEISVQREVATQKETPQCGHPATSTKTQNPFLPPILDTQHRPPEFLCRSARERHALLVQREGGNPRSRFSQIVLKTAFFPKSDGKLKKSPNSHRKKARFRKIARKSGFSRNCTFFRKKMHFPKSDRKNAF